MALAGPRRPKVEKSLGIARVHDVLDWKTAYGLDHGPGVVLILDSFTVEAPESLIGNPARVQTPAGRTWDVTIDVVRDHGITISLFIKNLTSREWPIGSLVSLALG